jgi:hypothetical protein
MPKLQVRRVSLEQWQLLDDDGAGLDGARRHEATAERREGRHGDGVHHELLAPLLHRAASLIRVWLLQYTAFSERADAKILVPLWSVLFWLDPH